MSALDKEPVKRVEKFLKNFDPNLNVMLLDTSARTALEAATSLKCDVGAIIKSLLFKTENSFTLCLVAGDKKASLNKIKKTCYKKIELHHLICQMNMHPSYRILYIS